MKHHNAHVNRDKDMMKKPATKTNNPGRHDLRKAPGTRKKDVVDDDTKDIAHDNDMKLTSESHYEVDGFLMVSTSLDNTLNRRSDMAKRLVASFSNNVAEFSPGDKVIQVYPVARPLVGVVTGSSKVEGKVYVSWNGRVIQHDPEEIQLASCTPFFMVSRGKVSSSEQDSLERYVKAFNEAKDGNELSSFEFAKKLISSGFEVYDSIEMALNHVKTHIARKNNRLTAEMAPAPTAGENVVLLNDNGRKPGVVALLVSTNGNDAVIDMSTSWTSRRDGSNLMKVPMMMIVPVESPVRNSLQRGVPGCPYAPCGAGFRRRYFNNACTLLVDHEPQFKAKVGEGEAKTLVSSEVVNGDVKRFIVAAIGTNDGELYSLYRQELPVGEVGNFTDAENVLRRLRTIIGTANSTALRFVREKLDPQYVVDDQWRFIEEHKA